MVNIKKVFDEGIENLEKGIVSQVKTNAKAVGGQVGVSVQNQGDTTSSQAGESAEASSKHDNTDEVVNSFYAPSNPDEKHGFGSKHDQKEPSEFLKNKVEEGMDVEDAVKLESLRSKLHQEQYYIPLTKRKPMEEEQEEEKQQEEQEKKMEELKMEDKKKKDDDIAIRQAAQKTEKFPGAAG